MLAQCFDHFTHYKYGLLAGYFPTTRTPPPADALSPIAIFNGRCLQIRLFAAGASIAQIVLNIINILYDRCHWGVTFPIMAIIVVRTKSMILSLPSLITIFYLRKLLNMIRIAEKPFARSKQNEGETWAKCVKICKLKKKNRFTNEKEFNN